MSIALVLGIWVMAFITGFIAAAVNITYADKCVRYLYSDHPEIWEKLTRATSPDSSLCNYWKIIKSINDNIDDKHLIHLKKVCETTSKLVILFMSILFIILIAGGTWIVIVLKFR